MSQGKRVIDDDEFSCYNKQPIQPDKVKKTAKKRGRINVNACYRCRRDKKKCDGNYSTKESCKYCRHHKVECSYPEPGRRRVKIAQSNVEDIKPKAKEAKRIKKVDTRSNPMKDIHERMIKVEENLCGVTELLANVRQPDIKEITKQLIIHLLIYKSNTYEQILLLRSLLTLIDKKMNCSTCDEEYLYSLYKKLKCLESDQEEVRSHMWIEIQNVVDGYNDTADTCENETSAHSLLPTFIPSYTTTPLNVSKSPTPQPQSLSPIPLEFDNNNYSEKLSYENICQHTLNVQTTARVINNPLTVQTKSLPFVPSQRGPHIRVKCLKEDDDNRNIKQLDFQESGTSNEFVENDDPFTFNNCHYTSPNSTSYIDSSTSIVDKLNNETDYFHLTNKSTTDFTCFQSTMSSPLFPNENCGAPTFDSLQPSPLLHPLNEIEHLYCMNSPTNSATDYIQQSNDEIVLRTIEQYPMYLPTSSL